MYITICIKTKTKITTKADFFLKNFSLKTKEGTISIRNKNTHFTMRHSRRGFWGVILRLLYLFFNAIYKKKTENSNHLIIIIPELRHIRNNSTTHYALI